MTIVALVVLLAGEAFARGLSPYLPEPLLYGDATTQVKVAQLDHLAPSCVEVILAGDSMGRDAFDPNVFTSTDPIQRRAYNASLDGASPTLLRRWITDEVVPRLDPSTVVIAVSSLDLNAHANATTSALDAYDAAPLTSDDPGAGIGSWFIRTSAVVRHRTELRNPDTLLTGIERWRAGEQQPRRSPDGIPGLVGASGEGLSRRSLRYRHDVATKSFTRDQLLAGFTIDEQQVDEATELVRDLQVLDIKVALVILPVTGDYLALHPNGQRDFDAFLNAITSIAAAAGVPLIDLHAAVHDEAMFADTHHLNGDGQRWFSSVLGERLSSAGIDTRRRCA